MNNFILLSILGCLQGFSSQGIDPTCDYTQTMVLNQDYYIYNREYSNNYPGNTRCRWQAKSPEGSQIKMTCSDFHIPESYNCNSDRYAVSLSGDPNLNDAVNYCGHDPFEVTTTSNALSVGLFADNYSPGGRVLCTIRATSPCQCGWRKQRRIVGGEETGVNEFVYVAALIDLIARTVYCGATIISERYALTAVHCMTNKNLWDMGLLVGDHNVDQGNDTYYSTLHLFENYIPHPNYNTASEQNDIAILKTQTPIIFSIAVGPVCLPFIYENYDFVSQPVTVLGWGLTEFTGEKSPYLQKADLQVVNNYQCPQDKPIAYSQMCAYANGKDACQFDSGGPLIFHDWTSNSDMLTGIVSYGKACGSDVPGVYTRVSSFLYWIQQNTLDANYCRK